jgi:hypothetical protein
MTTLTTRPWDDWEDYTAGLYQHVLPVRAGKVQDSIRLLSDQDRFAEAAREMIREWPTAARHNLNLPSGRRSWIGQAACCYSHGATSEETACAWGHLSNRVQRRANQIADAVASEYREGRSGAQALFAD